MENEEVKKIIEEFLNKMGVAFTSVDVVIGTTEGDPTPLFVIRTSESGILIGKGGEHFTALKYLVKKIVQKKYNSEDVKINLDVNDYQAKMLNGLRNKIRIMGDRAISFKIDIELEPMSPYERMIVHSFFSENPALRTESVGLGKNRRVVIRYSPDKQVA